MTKMEYKRRFKPWITDNILEKINKKNKAFRKYMNCRNEPIKEQLNREYKVIKNEITTLTRQSKKDYYNRYFTENTNNLQKIWKGIKEIINIKTKNYTSHPTCILDNNTTITDPRKIADTFNNYYTSVADDILQERKYEGNKQHSDYLSNPIAATFAIYECDQLEVEHIISSLNKKKL